MGILDNDTSIGVPKPTERVRPASEAERKTPPRVNGVSGKKQRGNTPRHEHPPAPPPDEEPELEYKGLLTLLVDAVARFNEDLQQSNAGLQARLWDRGNGFHIQIIRETDDAIVHQSALLMTADVDKSNIVEFINEFIREKGLFIDERR